MASLPYWMFPRPHRKLSLVPQAVAALKEVADGVSWTGKRELHIAFEEALERAGLKRRGERRDRGGSGGRTHAALIASLGFSFIHEQSGRLMLTLAGEALASNAPPGPIIKKQVLDYQFPSPYSLGPNTNVDKRFQLRPLILLLRTLLETDITSITQEEIALLAVTMGEDDSKKASLELAERVKDFREFGLASLPKDFAHRFTSSRGQPRHVRATLNDISNTAVNWLMHTGFVERHTSTLTVPKTQREAAEHAVEYHGSRPLIKFYDEQERFQRRYGLPPGRSKDNRNVANFRHPTQAEQIERRVRTILVGKNRTSLVDQMTPELVIEVATATGFSESQVEGALSKLIPTRAEALGSFLDSYRMMAESGIEMAREFEQATATVFNSVLKIEAEHVGQQGPLPDLVVRLGGGVGLIDTKAYPNYDLPRDHMLRMRGYVEHYAASGNNVLFTLYLAGGFSSSIGSRLAQLTTMTGVPASAIGMPVWLELVKQAQLRLELKPFLMTLMSRGGTVSLSDISRKLSAVMNPKDID